MHACATIAPGMRGVVGREARRLDLTPVEDDLDNAGWVALRARGPAAVADALHRLRTVHRFGVVLAAGRVDPAEPWDGLGDLVDGIDAPRWFSGGPFAVRAHRSGEHPFTSVDVEARVGSQLHDHLEAELGARPPVDLDDPDAILRVHLDGDGRARLWLDLAGPASLHRRGYRVRDHPAAAKASLACGLLELADWRGGGPLADPMAGGGTLVAEAAWRAADVAPTRLRGDLLADNAPALGGERPAPTGPAPADLAGDLPELVLGDHAPNRVEDALCNLEAAGVRSAVDAYVGDVEQLPDHVDGAEAVLANPPYGIRSGEGPLDEVYERLVDAAADALAPGGRLAAMTPRESLLEQAADERGLDEGHRLRVQHGRLEVALVALEA